MGRKRGEFDLVWSKILSRASEKEAGEENAQRIWVQMSKIGRGFQQAKTAETAWERLHMKNA